MKRLYTPEEKVRGLFYLKGQIKAIEEKIRNQRALGLSEEDVFWLNEDIYTAKQQLTKIENDEVIRVYDLVSPLGGEMYYAPGIEPNEAHYRDHLPHDDRVKLAFYEHGEPNLFMTHESDRNFKQTLLRLAELGVPVLRSQLTDHQKALLDIPLQNHLPYPLETK
jgi:hypothetical protein